MKVDEKGKSILLTCTQKELLVIMKSLKSAANKADKEGNTEKANLLNIFQGNLNAIQCEMYSAIKFNVIPE
jgi:hypothetical protein